MSKRKRRQQQLRRQQRAALAGSTGLMVAAAPGQLGVDREARTISGLVVPFGKAGHTSGGRLTFDAGSLQVSDPRRVKLLREHDQRDVTGYATELVEGDDGLRGTFYVPEGPNGDQALAEAENGLRDAFSVGVQLDDATLTRLRRSQGAPVKAAGQLREVSQVSVPAFDDARVAASTGAQLVVSSWSTTTPEMSTAGAPANQKGTTTMTEAQRRRLAELIVQASLSTDEQDELRELQNLATAAGLGTVRHPIPSDDDKGDDDKGDKGADDKKPKGSRRANAGAGPEVVTAAAGAAYIESQPSTYNFDGTGSLVRDAFTARMDGDTDAAARVRRFNAELRDGNPASVAALATAAATRTDHDGQGTPAPDEWLPTGRKPELMRDLVDAGRPIISRLTPIPISNASPFAIPEVGDFDGVDDHTEGTSHNAAGSLTLSGDSVQPTAVSGAYRVSRELVDSSNPAIDRIAARLMLRDYRRKSEAKVVALFNARAAQAATDATAMRYGVANALQMRDAMLAFVNDDEEAANLALVSKVMQQALGLDTDASDRPQLPFVGASNAVGTMRRPGDTGFSIDGQDITRSARLDSGITGTEVPAGGVGVLARTDGVLWAESPVLQFRFDEVEGPGIVKLALWAYNGAAILDVADVQVLAVGTDPTP